MIYSLTELPAVFQLLAIFFNNTFQ